jgi:hypothetical protein
MGPSATGHGDPDRTLGRLVRGVGTPDHRAPSLIAPVEEATLSATGHVVGAYYFSSHYRMTYLVIGLVTLWDLAPNEAVRLRWSNGNVTVSTMPVGSDEIIPPPRGWRPGAQLAA